MFMVSFDLTLNFFYMKLPYLEITVPIIDRQGGQPHNNETYPLVNVILLVVDTVIV